MTSSATADRPVTKASPTTAPASLWIWAALAVSGLALAGSLLLSWGLGLKACPLCFYQRAFAMSLVAVLGIGLIAAGQPDRGLGLLSLPLATAGLGVALFHVSLELRGKLECPAGLFGVGSAPQQSLAAFAIVFALLLLDVLRRRESTTRRYLLPGALVLGAVLAVVSCTANPPMPQPPPGGYTTPLDVCRPPFRG